jgi:pimeloyl-ACP methyl ester carboxylesterase
LKRTHIAMLVGSIFCLAVLGAIGLTRFGWSVFPYTRANIIEMLQQGTSLDKRAAYVTPAETVFLETDGLRLVADLYLPPGQGPAPALVMLHGSSRWGRKIGINRLLSSNLAKQGYVVLAIDFRGFGESDNPIPADDTSSWRMENDIRAGVDYLAAHARVMGGKIDLVGHSMGGAYGIYGGIHDERIGKIVAVGPPRRWLERFQEEKMAFVEGFAKRRNLEQPVSLEVVSTVEALYAVDHTFGYFEQQGHKPLLLIDGGLESQEDRAFLRYHHGKMCEPTQYATMEGTCHYFGIIGLEWLESVPVLRNMLIYDHKIVGEVVGLINSFLRD